MVEGECGADETMCAPLTHRAGLEVAPANLNGEKMHTWTQAEEDAFSQLMQGGRMKRMGAIRLYRRCKDNLKRALSIAAADAPTAEDVTRRAAFGQSARLRAAKRREATAA
jgi:hypothetical protein